MAQGIGEVVPRGDSWTAWVFGEGESGIWWTELARIGTGAGFASLYGLALGTREGGLALVHHALGVPAALLALVMLGVPALWILSTLLGAEISAAGIARAAAKMSVTAGLVLAGLAPIAALYVVTSDSDFAAHMAACAGLLVGGGLGIRALVQAIRRETAHATDVTRALVHLLTLAFVVFAALLEARVWSASLPMLHDAKAPAAAATGGAQ